MDKSVKPKILFTFVEAGMGHIIPMTGISDAFEKKYGDKCKIIRSYVFKESNSKAVNKMGAIQDSHTKRLGKNIFYRTLESITYSFSSKFTLWCLDLIYGKGRKEFFNDLKNFNADMVVSTYYLPSHLARQANEKKITNSIIVSYAPDPYVYPAWDRKCDRLYVLDEFSKNQAIKTGFEKLSVKRVPFVYKKTVVEGWIDKNTARQKLSLDKKDYVLLYTAGAHGSSNTEKLIKKLLKLDIQMECVVVCGKNQGMYKSLIRLKNSNKSKVKLTPLAFVNNLNEYMCAANAVIGKSALMTIMESRYHGLPFIMHNEQSRVEAETAKFAVRERLAIREHNPKKVAQLIKLDVENQGYLKKLLGEWQIRPNNGAETVANDLFELLKTRFPEL